MQYPSAADFFASASSLVSQLKGKKFDDKTAYDAWVCVGYGLSLGLPLPAPSALSDPAEALVSFLEPHVKAPHWGQPGHPILTGILKSLLPILLQLLGGIGKGGSGAAA